MTKKPVANPWRIQRHYREIEIPHTAHKEIDRSYTYTPAYHDIICEIFAEQHDLIERDLKLILHLYKNKYFTFNDVANFPHKPRRWGPVMQKKTVQHFMRSDWIRLHKNNSRSNPRLFGFTDKACIELTRLYRALYMMEPLGTARFPVPARFYDNVTYARAINEINKFVKKSQQNGKKETVQA